MNPGDRMTSVGVRCSVALFSEIWLTIVSNFNNQVSKKFTPQVSSWFSTTKGIDCEESTHDKANLTSSGHS